MKIDKIIGFIICILFILIITFILICCLRCDKIIKIYPEENKKNKFIISV